MEDKAPVTNEDRAVKRVKFRGKKQLQKNSARGGCLHCPGNHDSIPMNTKIIAGFGSATITKNGKYIYTEKPNLQWEDAPTLMKFELMARKDPNADWRYDLDLPLSSGVWQRHGKNEWVLIKSGMGFA